MLTGVHSGFTTEVSVWLPLNGDDNINVVYVGTEVWTGVPMTCSSTCVLVLPTSTLAAPTVIDPGLYTTSFEYGHISTVTGANGVTATTFITQTTTVIITVPKTTVTVMSYSNINVTSGQTPGSVVVQPSVNLPPVGVPLPDGSGGTTTRSVLLPPWPAITNGPPVGWTNPTDPFDVGGPGGTAGSVPSVYHTQYSTTVSAAGPTIITLSFPRTVSPRTVNCPPDSTIAFNTPRTVITANCDRPTAFTLGFTCAPTKVITFLAASTGVFTVDCTLATSFNSQPTDSSATDTTATKTTTTPLPIWATWPAGIITPVPTPVNDQEPTDDGVITPCKLWFFSVSLHKRDRLHEWTIDWLLRYAFCATTSTSVDGIGSCRQVSIRRRFTSRLSYPLRRPDALLKIPLSLTAARLPGSSPFHRAGKSRAICRRGPESRKLTSWHVSFSTSLLTFLPVSARITA